MAPLLPSDGAMKSSIGIVIVMKRGELAVDEDVALDGIAGV